MLSRAAPMGANLPVTRFRLGSAHIREFTRYPTEAASFAAGSTCQSARVVVSTHGATFRISDTCSGGWLPPSPWLASATTRVLPDEKLTIQLSDARHGPLG